MGLVTCGACCLPPGAGLWIRYVQGCCSADRSNDLVLKSDPVDEVRNRAKVRKSM